MNQMTPCHGVVTTTGLARPTGLENSIQRLAVRLLCFGVAIGVVVHNLLPYVLFIHVADDLLVTHLGLELDPLTTVSAIDLAARVNEPGHGPAYKFDLDRLVRFYSLRHVGIIGTKS